MDIYQILTIIVGLSGIGAIFSTFVIWLTKHLKSKYDDEKLENIIIKKSLQALLRNQLLQQHKFYMKQKWIPFDEKENYDNMYQCYHSLGKNGVMDNAYKEIMALPATPPSKNNKK